MAISTLVEAGAKRPGPELNSLAPNMPEVIPALGRCSNFAISSPAEEGSPYTILRLEPIDQLKEGYRVAESIELSPMDAISADTWITQANQALSRVRITPLDFHRLSVAGDVTRTIVREIEKTKKKQPPTP